MNPDEIHREYLSMFSETNYSPENGEIFVYLGEEGS
jgi:hypothetical protein